MNILQLIDVEHIIKILEFEVDQGDPTHILRGAPAPIEKAVETALVKSRAEKNLADQVTMSTLFKLYVLRDELKLSEELNTPHK